MGLAALASCNLAEKNQVPELQASTTQQALIERGEYLVTAAGCHDCHSPKVFGSHGPEPDPERLLSGHPSDMSVPKIDTAILKSWVLFGQDLTVAVGPWGASFAANLTSDPTGIGNWSEVQFFKAIREGKYKGLDNSRMLLPPMPWPNVAQLSDEDLRSIFAYLKSTKPVKNVVPAPIPPTDLVNLSM
jgi:mono/diheme cytochrome c family protein